MSRSTRNGSTLIGVIIVIALIGLAAGLFLPATRRVRDAASRTDCLAKLRDLGLAMHNFHDTGRPAPRQSAGDPELPGEGIFPRGCFGPGSVCEERLSWMAALVPYLEQNVLPPDFNLEKGYMENRPAVQQRMKMFICRESKEATTNNAVTTYVAISGIGHSSAWQPAGTPGNGFMGYDRATSMKMIEDGSSNTIALMETGQDLGSWARGGPSTLRGFEPTDMLRPRDQRPFGGQHTAAISVGMADASSRSLSSSIDPKILAGGITIAGGEKTGPLY